MYKYMNVWIIFLNENKKRAGLVEVTGENM